MIIPDIHLSNLVITEASDCSLTELSQKLISVVSQASKAAKIHKDNDQEARLLIRVSENDTLKFLDTPFGLSWVYDIATRENLSELDPLQSKMWLILLERHAEQMTQRVKDLKKGLNQKPRKKRKSSLAK